MPKRGISRIKQKSEHHYWILHIQINWNIKFQLKLAILYCWTKFARKRYFWSKAEKMRIFFEICIFKSVWIWNLSFKQQFYFLRRNLPEKSISALKKTSEHPYWTLHIQITLSTKFQLEIKNFDFLEQICLKCGISTLKQKKWKSLWNSAHSI